MKQQATRKLLLTSESAIREEVQRKKLEFAELSPLMRELLGMVFIRGGLEAMKALKEQQL